MKKIGQLLLQNHHVTTHQLTEALETQRKTGGALGSILVAEGSIKAVDFQATLAEQKKREFVFLTAHPADESLWEKDRLAQYRALQFVPYRQADAALTLAIANPSQAVEAEITELYPGQKLRWIVTSPRDVREAIQRHFSVEESADATDGLWQQKPLRSARKLWQRREHILPLLLVIFTIVALAFYTQSLMGLFIAISIFYCATILFKCLIVQASCAKETSVTSAESPRIPDADLPLYTILIPMFRENQNTLENLVRAIQALDYPKSKLDVKLILEEQDTETYQLLRAIRPDAYMEIIRVPFSLPQTKPKACNYALNYARGEYITIYDAEDIPDPEQLRKAITAFRTLPKNVGCLQARLNYYNYHENALTKLFALEYGVWFEFMLKGLERLGLPIPLGGTSNHMRTDLLRELGAWDPYNVTEDADLGLRLEQLGYRTMVLDSLTLEEAPITLGGWIRQRSRWIKGYLQTFIVNCREPLTTFRTLGFYRFMGFVFFIGAPGFVFLTLPFMLIASVMIALSSTPLAPWFAAFSLFNLVFAVVSHIVFARLVIQRFQWHNMFLYAYIFPLYWLLHSLASFKALWQLIVRPHFWEKTEHGQSRFFHTFSAFRRGLSMLDKPNALR